MQVLHQNSYRESIQEVPNPLGMQSIEFIEYNTSKPKQLGQVLKTMGLLPWQMVLDL